ncbi:AAA family ATPase [Chitinivorax sp. B]|uniref:ATP-binding protein n=1 Tax=Chitinivorax sp. B TaxID=2502235 RepID=UPI0014851BDF|nr:AAA family ATPase [Chitinivorax sp. B]
MQFDQDVIFTLNLYGVPCLFTHQTEIRLERKDAGMVAYLAFEQTASRAKLASLFWPDTDAEKARRNLRQRLLRLRRLVGLPLIDGDQILSLHAQIQSNTAIQTTETDQHGLLSAFQYEDLPEFQAWLDRIRVQLGMQAQLGIKRQMQQAEAAMALEEAIAAAYQLLALDAVDEDAYRCLIKCHYLKGDRAAALDAYRHCQLVLAKELGVAPSEETEFLRKQLQEKVLAAATASPLPMTVLRPPQLVGRQVAWQWLTEQWQSKRVSLISGKAGVGKTRLAGEFCEQQTGKVLRIEGRPGDVAIPYLFLSRMMRVMLPLLGDELPTGVRTELSRLLPELASSALPMQEDDRACLINAVEFVVRQMPSRPISGVMIDDLHYADQASLETVSAVIPATIAQGLPWVMTFREEGMTPHLQRLQADFLQTEWGATLSLLPLSLDQTSSLIESLVLPTLDLHPLTSQLHHRAGGNPMMLLEIIKAILQQWGGSGELPMQLPIPDNVKAIFKLRLGSLSSQALALARCAAVAGECFCTELAQAVLGVSLMDLISPWAELEQAQILENQALVHDTLAEATLAEIPGGLLQLLHFEVASFLEHQEPPPVHLLVRHWQQAGKPEKALPLMLQEADTACRAGKCLEEITWLELALPLLEADDGTNQVFDIRYRLFCRYRLARPLYLLVGQVEAMAVLAEGEVQYAWLTIAQSELALLEGDADTARELADEALETAYRLDHHGLIFDATKALTKVLQHQECYDLALQEVDKVQGMLRISDHALNIDSALHYAIALLDADRCTECLLYVQHAMRMESEQSHQGNRFQLSLVAGHAEFTMGDVAKALQHFRYADTLHSTHMPAPNIWQGRYSCYADILRQAGHFQQALAILELARARQIEVGSDRQALDCYALAQLYWQLGQPAKAKPLMEESLRIHGKSPCVEAQGWILQARLSLATQQVPRADLLQQALDILPESGKRNLRIMALLALAEIPNRPAAYQEARQAWKMAHGHDLWGLQAASLAAMAREALKLGRREEATMHALSAVALLLNYVPGDIYPMTVWREVYEVLQSQAYQAAADTALEYASRWLARVAACDVPLEYRDSFFNRNPDNKLFLHLARFRQPSIM